MRRVSTSIAAAALAWILGAGSAWACDVQGQVVCRANGAPLAGVVVTFTLEGNAFTATTDATGTFAVHLEWPNADYDVTLDLQAVGGGVVDLGPQHIGTGDLQNPFVVGPYEVDVPGCGEQTGMCWLTGGGAKFSGIAGSTVAEHGPRINFGGNVYPSCSPEPGQGGQWNHIDHSQKLHFQGIAIVVDQCGNVGGIPDGSTSPVTPFNFIEFHGTGVLKGIAGSKYPTTEACFEGRAEDRNEPGSSGERDGAYKDRYFIRVFDCVTGTTLLVHEATPGGNDPVVITDGNLQLHASSCAQ